MAVIETTITISHPISDVYMAATNYEDSAALEQWQNINSLGVTAGKPLRAGSMIAMKKRFRGSDIFVNFDVLEYQRNKRFATQGVHGRFNFSREIDFTPSGRETIVKDVIELRVSRLFFWYSPIVTSALRRQLQQEWQALKAILEQS